MARPPSRAITNSERAILEVLWDRQEASVRDVAEALSVHKPAAYTTVLTMFSILSKKGLVTHRVEGKAFIYRAAISRETARQQAVDQLLAQFFDDSAKVLALHLVEAHHVDPVALKALQDKVTAAKAKRSKS